MQLINLPTEHYLELIGNNRPFSFSRFGDGEVLCMHNTTWLEKNCDGSHFMQDLIAPMKQIFINQYPYYHCLLQCSFDLEGEWFKTFISETCPNMPFYDGEVWQKISFEGRILELVEKINLYKTCLVGPPHIKNFRHIKGLNTEISVIETPETDSFRCYHKIYDQIMSEHNNGCRFFGFSTGYTSKILIDNLFPYIGHNSFLIDFGSVFDPYCGKLSRSGMVHVGFNKFQPYTNYKLG
jgi:hypothetical protein